MNQPDTPVTFVVPGDLHLTDPGLENVRVAHWMVDEVNRLIRPDFVQFIGDNVQDATAEQFLLFNEIRSRLHVPHFVLVGDHDVHDDPEARGFRRFVGETHGATSLRGFRFVRLDTQEARPLGLSPEQVAWLRHQVDSALAAGERVILFQHNYPYQIWEDFAGPGIDGWREVVQTRRIAAIISGHTHYLQAANDGRNVAIAVRSIGDPEGGAPGYLVGLARGEDLATTYRTVEDAGPLVLITHPRETIAMTGPGHVVRGADRFEVRVWSASGPETVRGRVDEGGWIALEPIGEGLWSCPLEGDRLSKGEHAFEALAIDGDGLEGRHRIVFAVDPTGRYTAVPAVHPRVVQTAFC
jgi:3',5'-cyclic-AMP phosphodiesterase